MWWWPLDRRKKRLSHTKSRRRFFTRWIWTSGNLSLTMTMQAIHSWKGLERQIHAEILGIMWNSMEDQLQLVCNYPHKRKIRKRTTSQQVASVYDPLGWLTPITLHGKRFLFICGNANTAKMSLFQKNIKRSGMNRSFGRRLSMPDSKKSYSNQRTCETNWVFRW